MTIIKRPRRMRESSFSRTLMRENNISVNNLIYPIFVIEGNKVRQDIESMPGIQRLSIDELIIDATECHKLGIPAIAIFPCIEKNLKTKDAREAFNDNGLVQKAIKKIKKELPE
ncbi:MAG: porphobilinogen synthase, partial [Nitrosomonadales bacterium]|nr:porphobilinogen synthase [Nitrosomonadales bacterium]